MEVVKIFMLVWLIQITIADDNVYDSTTIAQLSDGSPLGEGSPPKSDDLSKLESTEANLDKQRVNNYSNNDNRKTDSETSSLKSNVNLTDKNPLASSPVNVPKDLSTESYNSYNNENNNNNNNHDNNNNNRKNYNNNNNNEKPINRNRKIASVPLRKVVNGPTIDRNNQNNFVVNKNNRTTDNEDYERELRMQAESAKYSFSSSVENSINDNSHSRQEVRDGLKLTGHYSYRDGYFQRTVHYVADDKGYRVTKEIVEKIGDGPIENNEGSAVVNVMVNNQDPLNYSIKGEDLKRGKNTRTSVSNAKNNRNKNSQL